MLMKHLKSDTNNSTTVLRNVSIVLVKLLKTLNKLLLMLVNNSWYLRDFRYMIFVST